MKIEYRSKCTREKIRVNPRRAIGVVALVAASMISLACPSYCQSSAAQSVRIETTEERLQRLSASVLRVQAQMDAYKTELQDLETQLAALRQQMEAGGGGTAIPAPVGATNRGDPAVLSTSIEEVNERQAVEESQIATHEQSKVETVSKYPLKVTGLLLFNSYVNTRRVDTAVNPTYALDGGGSTGFSLRQTVLGFDASGPHLLGAASFADLRVDFFGNSGSQSSYAATGLLRLRTAHAGLRWHSTEAFVELDRTLLAPNIPTSLVATSQPDLSWSGDLWMWVPQVGIKRSIDLSGSKRLDLQAALIDPADPVLPGATPTVAISRAERSRWPGTEARISFGAGERGVGPEIGIGGYFSPHTTGNNVRFNAWAGTLDLRVPMGRHVELTGNAYRGQALGGLGGGGYVDYYYQNVQGRQVARPLDDVGGWAQLKGKVDERLQVNAGFGIDNPFAVGVREAAAAADASGYQGLAKNRSAYVNVIYSPSSYLLFSVEYRKLWSNYVTGSPRASDVIGIGAGYKF
jgi:hypothetical protein